jgi:hypothetical protein
MKLIFRQYLASLRERRELDAVLPDLLSELGYTVISRPTVGTRQYGVDVAAVGIGPEGKRKLYLFSIKQGDLTRADWDGNPQALRSSINDILDVYIPARIPPAYRKLEIVICLCFGGDVQEAVRDNVTQFTDAHTTQRISFEEWNGDYIANLLVQGVLREHLVDKSLRASFQKAVAMVDEPDTAFTHFAALVRQLSQTGGSTARARATLIRQIYICLWVFFVWARDAGNLEGPYRASELAILHAWHIVHQDVANSSKAAQEVGAAFAELVNLHFTIWDALLGEKILPFADVKHAVSVAVDSASPVDLNLRLFETLGRIAIRGLWMLWFEGGSATVPTCHPSGTVAAAEELARKLVQLIRNNPALLQPITEAETANIGITLLFLTMMKDWRPAAANYAEALIERITFAYRTHARYPTTETDYRGLIGHPRERTDAYREAHTKGSSILPLLGLWASSLGKAKIADWLAKFAEKYMAHCNEQFWIADADTELHLYRGDERHGAALNHVPITTDGEAAIAMLDSECREDNAFEQLSAIKLAHWPILALACRHYRLPLPPNLWLDLLLECRSGQLRAQSADTKDGKEIRIAAEDALYPENAVTE